MTVESVKESVTGAVGGRTRAVCLASLAKLLGLATKGTLIAV